MSVSSESVVITISGSEAGKVMCVKMSNIVGSSCNK